MMQAMTVPTPAQARLKELKTAIAAAALAAGLILVILLLSKTTVSTPRLAFETILFAFPLGATGAHVYIWLAAKVSILGRVTRTNLAATLKALLILVPLFTVLSLVGIALGAPRDAQVWIVVAIILSCVFSDAAYARARRIYGYK